MNNKNLFRKCVFELNAEAKMIVQKLGYKFLQKVIIFT